MMQATQIGRIEWKARTADLLARRLQVTINLPSLFGWAMTHGLHNPVPSLVITMLKGLRWPKGPRLAILGPL
jgi:hypothetical protein